MAAAGVEYRCFVGGLAWATNNESLEHAFASYGEILDSKVCFVSFSLGFILVSLSLGFIPWSLCAAVMLDPCRGSIDCHGLVWICVRSNQTSSLMPQAPPRRARSSGGRSHRRRSYGPASCGPCINPG